MPFTAKSVNDSDVSNIVLSRAHISNHCG